MLEDKITVMNKNEIIQDCIDVVKSLIQPHCKDHTPYWGPCVSCGSHYNYDGIDIDELLESLENLKTF